MTTLIDIFAIAAYKLKQSKPIIEILRNNQANHTSLCIPTWFDSLILSASRVRNTSSPSQKMLLG